MIYDIKDIKGQVFSSTVDGYDSVFIANLLAKSSDDILYIVSDGLRLRHTVSFLSYILPDTQVLSLPAWDTVPYDRISPNSDVMGARVETLSELAIVPNAKKPRIIVASISAVLQKLPPQKIFINSQKSIKVGGLLDFTKFIHYAIINGYTRVEQVMEKGEYAIRGDILDIFPSSFDEPIRIDVFGDEVERIRTFDPLSQRTTGEISHYDFQVMGEVVLDEKTIKTFRQKYREEFGAGANLDDIYEAISSGQKYMGLENWLPLFYEDSLPSIFDYIPMANVIYGASVLDAMSSKNDSIMDYYLARQEALKGIADSEDVYRPINPSSFYLTKEELLSVLKQKNAIGLTDMAGENSLEVVPSRDFSNLKNQGFPKLYEQFKDYLNENKGLKRILCFASEGSRDKSFKLMNEFGFENMAFADSWKEAVLKASSKIVMIVYPLSTGFKGDGFLVASEQDILGEKQSKKAGKKVSSKDFIADVSALSVGDLVVHIEHGVGRFLGLENIIAGGIAHDCLKILYAHDAKLFVPVENIDVISRYGIDSETIVLDTLGSASWQAKKARVKQRIRDIASSLIAIAAKRTLQKSEVFIADSGLYEEFCTGFVFQETQDQQNAIDDVLGDLSLGRPMDRLICGDVGFGKTEVAMRAAFVVASSGAQVAIIAPTTLLVRQHYHNFKKRMKDFPIRVKMLSRLVAPKEAKEVKEGLKNGSVDIVIGTHALLAKDMAFSNLGLLIVDEEQHFGVVHKERLKELKSGVHVMTLTATPIPRTLQLSLTGVKELSVIGTPPVDRLVARSFMMPFDKVMIREAIHREKFRNGQTFFVCPRISDMYEVEKILQEIVPEVRVAVAHGQMPVKQLEDIMNDFADNKFDILLSTTIIESGIDMPSVNTMIIYRSDMFGLAQLYQLRGRIGRSKVRGYCYFTIPQKKKISAVALRRLNILKALDSLGSGFSLASHDMDIRGSGNILGDEQSGHIKEVGIALYQNMLEEEIARLKSGDFGKQDDKLLWIPQILTGIPIMIPEEYVKDLGVRLGLYKRIGNLASKEEIMDMREELIDRFGAIPEAVEHLLLTVEIKQLCKRANIEKVDAGAKGALITFKDNVFAKPENLIRFISGQFGVLQIRPDQKLFLNKNLESYKTRAQTIRTYLEKIVELL